MDQEKERIRNSLYEGKEEKIEFGYYRYLASKLLFGNESLLVSNTHKVYSLSIFKPDCDLKVEERIYNDINSYRFINIDNISIIAENITKVNGYASALALNLGYTTVKAIDQITVKIGRITKITAFLIKCLYEKDFKYVPLLMGTLPEIVTILLDNKEKLFWN